MIDGRLDSILPNLLLAAVGFCTLVLTCFGVLGMLIAAQGWAWTLPSS